MENIFLKMGASVSVSMQWSVYLSSDFFASLSLANLICVCVMFVSREKPRVKLRGNSEDVTVVLKKDPEKLSID